MSLPGYSLPRIASIWSGCGIAVAAGIGVGMDVSVGVPVESVTAVEENSTAGPVGIESGLLIPQALVINRAINMNQ
jgi:hypothetical protein